MDNILIADSGSTKTDWSLLKNRDTSPFRLQTSGINPAHCSDNEIQRIILEVKNKTCDSKIDAIFFYGAGCATNTLKNKIRYNLFNIFNIEKIEVDSDLIAAAIALFGDKKGIACILGTGSNSGLYENGVIKKQIPPLGYILGDEGSGVSLCKILLNGIFKHQFPEVIIEKFKDEYHLTLPELINSVYYSGSPASFIASFSPFILNNIDIPELREMVIKEFENFFNKNILPYGMLNNTKVGMVGSIAYNYRDLLNEAAKKYGLTISTIIKNPLPFLETYFVTK